MTPELAIAVHTMQWPLAVVITISVLSLVIAFITVAFRVIDRKYQNVTPDDLKEIKEGIGKIEILATSVANIKKTLFGNGDAEHSLVTQFTLLKSKVEGLIKKG